MADLEKSRAAAKAARDLAMAPAAAERAKELAALWDVQKQMRKPIEDKFKAATLAARTTYRLAMLEADRKFEESRRNALGINQEQYQWKRW